MVKKPPEMPETWVQSLGQEDTLKEGMATHTSILAWKIPWTKKPQFSCSVVSDSLQPHGLYVHVILQARILVWVAIPFSRESSQPRDQTQVSCIGGRFFTI